MSLCCNKVPVPPENASSPNSCLTFVLHALSPYPPLAVSTVSVSCHLSATVHPAAELCLLQHLQHYLSCCTVLLQPPLELSAATTTGLLPISLSVATIAKLWWRWSSPVWRCEFGLRHILNLPLLLSANKSLLFTVTVTASLATGFTTHSSSSFILHCCCNLASNPVQTPSCYTYPSLKQTPRQLLVHSTALHITYQLAYLFPDARKDDTDTWQVSELHNSGTSYVLDGRRVLWQLMVQVV